jgi:protein SOK2
MYYQVQQYQPMYPGSVPQHQFQQYAMGYQQQPQVAATQQPQAAQQQSQQSQQPQSQQQQPPQYYPYQDYKPMNLPVRPIQAPPEASPVQRPKLTTTFWEDEGTVCYQVEARGISVSRREDTNFINGTKLLNVAGMTRGRRDGILKSEKVRYVVKIGAMNLKGVWIPFERALELARNEGIVDLLYPLFVKDIKELYQGPQYSGGLTAQANSNPRNIIPVTVTTSGYTPGAYASKKQPETPTTAPTTSSAPPNTSTTATTISDLAPQPHGHRQTSSSGPHEFPYGYGYQDHYQYPKGYYNYQPEEKEEKEDK